VVIPMAIPISVYAAVTEVRRQKPGTATAHIVARQETSRETHGRRPRGRHRLRLPSQMITAERERHRRARLAKQMCDQEERPGIKEHRNTPKPKRTVTDTGPHPS